MNGKQIMAGAMAALAVLGFSGTAEAGTTTTTHTTATRVSTMSAARSSSNAAARAAAASRASATHSAQARSAFSRSAASHSRHTQQERSAGIGNYYFIAASTARRQTTEQEQSASAGHRIDAAYSIKPQTLNNMCLEMRYATEKWNPVALRAAPEEVQAKISSLNVAFKKDGEAFRQSAPVSDRQLLAAALSCDMGL